MKTENILAKYFAGEAGPEEIRRVEQLKKEAPDEFLKYKKAYEAAVFKTEHFDTNRAYIRLLTKIRRRNISPAVLLKIAAVFTGLVLMATAYLFVSNSKKTVYHNQTGRIIKVILPDNSEILLDKNSTVWYSRNIWGKFNRKVNLQGRASFHVTKDPLHPFSVIDKRAVVTVLGTKFTVNDLPEHTQIFLTEGKVKITDSRGNNEIVISKKGEQVLINNDGFYKHNKINPALYASWRKKKIYFNNCTVKDVVELLNDSYNIKVNLSNGRALNKKLFGSAPSDDPQLIIEAISQIVQEKIEIN